MSELEEITIAARQLAGRIGSTGLELGWNCEHSRAGDKVDSTHHCDSKRWVATYRYYDGSTKSADPDPAVALNRLAMNAIDGGQCKCRRTSTTRLTAEDAAGWCLWRRVGSRWVPGCDAPPITFPKSVRGDLGGMERILEERDKGTTGG